MKIEIVDDTTVMSVTEVADALRNSGDLVIEDGEKMGDIRLECGCDLEIDILTDEPDDPRIDGHVDRTETFTITDIRNAFVTADYCTWAQDEDGDDILVCFGDY